MPKPKRKFDKIAFVASDMPEAVEARERLLARYGQCDATEADAISDSTPVAYAPP